MSQSEIDKPIPEAEELISFADFLESHPPGQVARIDKVWAINNGSQPNNNSRNQTPLF